MSPLRIHANKVILSVLLLLGGLLFYPTIVHGVTNSAPQKVLLAYDSLNVRDKGEEKISSLERLLTSLNVEVTTISIDDYKEKEVEQYTGLITMIQAPDLKIENQTFLKDRETYTGLKLHIGGNMPTSWQATAGIQLQSVIGESYTLSSSTNKAEETDGSSPSLEVAQSLPEGAPELGMIDFENQMAPYPYAINNNKVAYLPFYQTNGLSFLLATQLVQKWIAPADAEPAKFSPILVFTGITPFSNLDLLEYLADKMYAEGIPFVVSGTNVWVNTDLKAMDNYAETLRYVAARNGSFVLQTPEPRGLSKNKDDLNGIMNIMIDELVKRNVYPISISTPGYWNRDRFYQETALTFSDSVILLPNPANYQIKDANPMSKVFSTTYYGLPAENLQEIDWEGFGNQYFNMPTAITYDFPATGKELAVIEKELVKLPVLFKDIDLTNHQVATATNKIQVKQKMVEVNGKRRFTEAIPQERKKTENKGSEGSLAGFFNVQDKILTVIIIGVLFVLSIFFIVGYNLYRGKYRK